MKKLLSLASLSFIAILLAPSATFAAKPAGTGSGSGATPIVEYAGYDISYPQCGKKLPTDQYFGIVGVNGGTAASYNKCLPEQLAWATKSKSGFETHQDKTQLYVNTANPAADTAYDWKSWPTSGNTPYGSCEGVHKNNEACSWQYGWNRSAEAAAYFVSKATVAGISSNTADYTWWLDVETMNSWQTGSDDALSRNRAALEGFAAYYQYKTARVGLYSTEYQWGTIVGKNLITDGNLAGLPNWRPGGANLATAKSACSASPLTTGGYVSLTQYVSKNLDYNHSCV